MVESELCNDSIQGADPTDVTNSTESKTPLHPPHSEPKTMNDAFFVLWLYRKKLGQWRRIDLRFRGVFDGRSSGSCRVQLWNMRLGLSVV